MDSIYLIAPMHCPIFLAYATTRQEILDLVEEYLVKTAHFKWSRDVEWVYADEDETILAGVSVALCIDTCNDEKPESWIEKYIPVMTIPSITTHQR